MFIQYAENRKAVHDGINKARQRVFPGAVSMPHGHSEEQKHLVWGNNNCAHNWIIIVSFWHTELLIYGKMEKSAYHCHWSERDKMQNISNVMMQPLCIHAPLTVLHSVPSGYVAVIMITAELSECHFHHVHGTALCAFKSSQNTQP